MLTSDFLQIFGLMYFVIGLSLIITPHNLVAAIKDFTNPGGSSFMVGFVSIFVGAIIVTLHNQWNTAAEIVVSLFGWLAMLKGLFYLAAPTALQLLSSQYLSSPKKLRLVGVLIIPVSGFFYAWGQGWL